MQINLLTNSQKNLITHFVVLNFYRFCYSKPYPKGDNLLEFL